MEPTENDNLAPMRLATIVALRGQSSPEKSTLARQLAEFLKYPLLDEEDILNFSSTTCLEIILHMASLHLVHSQTGVVISAAAFSSPQGFQRLEDLKKSTGARMIVVLYEPKDHRSDLKDFPVVWIDPFKPVSLAGKLGLNILGLFTVARKTESTQNSHFHYLISLRNNQKRGETYSCRGCFKTISDRQLYRCEGCRDCAFHKDCAETPRFNRKKDSDKQIPPCFSGKSLSSSAEVEFPTRNPCVSCSDKGFSGECLECLYDAFIRSKTLPPVMIRTFHPHKLSLVILPRSYGYTYHCPICDADGEMAGYKCIECCLDFHPTCLVKSIPKKLKTGRHEHELKLQALSTSGGNDDTDSYCNVCQNHIEDPLVWRYVCYACKFSAHTTCLIEN